MGAGFLFRTTTKWSMDVMAILSLKTFSGSVKAALKSTTREASCRSQTSAGADSMAATRDQQLGQTRSSHQHTIRLIYYCVVPCRVHQIFGVLDVYSWSSSPGC